MEDDNARRPLADRSLLAVLGVLLIAYACAVALGWMNSADEILKQARHGAAAAGVPHYWSVIPFGLLLAAIAILPLLGRTAHWWESNLNKFYVSVNLALWTALYLAFLHPRGSLGSAAATIQHTVLEEYIPFIILLFTLYTISGGIRIAGDLPAHSLTNAAFLTAGGLLASLIGTTGAAMLLIRPLLETNSERKYVSHTVVFFIFIVANCGGCLLPIGDPPLFLGYLRGVDFLWTLSLWKSWLLVNGLLIAAYLVWDHFFAYRHESVASVARDETRVRPLRFAGLWPNALLLAGVIFSVATLVPERTFPGTHWHPWLYLREAVQLALVLVSLLLGSPKVRRANKFNYIAIVEVSALFLGIFICMQPALQILNAQGSDLPLKTAAQFFWATGSLSAILDNAPTYLVFFEAAQSLKPTADAVAGVDARLLAGISLGSVFMGAMTYIGNGPNFMVKAIAEKSGIAMPSFFGYLVYSLGVLLPLFAAVTWLFLR
jgi:Na+/H+ antiporter NhaD/arsenite permease-like protein